jgi:hypothetical protein
MQLLFDIDVVDDEGDASSDVESEVEPALALRALPCAIMLRAGDAVDRIESNERLNE